jgi:2-succinyl-6-hydroxy-2,4-cyclohexadiene-1-carboxylate synthase
LGDFELPVLLLCGEHDAKFRAINTEMHQQIPTSRLEIIPEAGHTIHVEQPERHIQTVRAFLEG